MVSWSPVSEMHRINQGLSAIATAVKPQVLRLRPVQNRTKLR
jgi:hypothetical protein